MIQGNREYNHKLDWEDFKELVLEMWRDDYCISKDHRVYCYEYFNPYWYDKEVLNNSDYLVLVHRDEAGDLLAFMIGHIRADWMDIIILYVDPAYRKDGIGSDLKTDLMTTAREMGLKKISALNRYDNPASLRMNISAKWKINKISEDYYRAEIDFDLNKRVLPEDQIAGAFRF